jgi:hypothetical protein
LPPAPAAACNTDAPVHPILQGHDYDAVAREALSRDATTIAVARFRGRLDLLLEGDSGQDRREFPAYVFELREGWKTPLPARLTVDGYWIPCDLPLRGGAFFLMFLQGSTPLHVLDAIGAESELAALGDIQWFYTQGRELMRPDVPGSATPGSGLDD